MRFLPVNDVAAAILPKARPSVDLAILFSQSRPLARPSLNAAATARRPAIRDRSMSLGVHPRSSRGSGRLDVSAPLGRGDAFAPVGGRQTGPRRFRAGFMESAERAYIRPSSAK